MIDYVLLADFHLKVGSTMSVQYPEPPLIQDTTMKDNSFIADFMLPEGSHYHEIVSTYFTLNRPSADHLHTLQ